MRLEKIKLQIKRFSNYVVVFLALILAISLLRSIKNISSGTERIKEARDRLEELKVETEEIRERVSEVKSPFFVEKEARDKLGLAKEGEIVVILPEEEILRRFSKRHEEEEEILPPATWRKWISLFF